jgi:L-rhamnonate dehydratase
MRICDVRATLLRERVLWARDVEDLVAIAPPAKRPQQASRLAVPGSVLVEVEGENGLVGLGLGGGGWPGHFVVERYLRPILLGADGMDTEGLWDIMYRSTRRYGRAGIVLMAISGVDLALWDLKGKTLGQPVYELLGGKVRESAPVYATARDPSWAQAAGFSAAKLGGPFGPAAGPDGMAQNVAFFAEIRRQVGPEMDLMIDCSSRWSVEYALEMARALEPHRISFIEEPVPPDDVAGYAQLRREVGTTQIAGGEHSYARYGAARLLEGEAVDILQPDIRWTGGLTELVRISDLAERHGVPLMPHRGAMAWSLHLIVARENCPLAEGLVLTREEADRSAFAGEPLPASGRVSPSDAPGFGLSLRPERVAELVGDA